MYGMRGMTMYGSVLDAVFLRASEELAKDPEIVTRFQELARTHLEKFIPEAAEKTAKDLTLRSSENALSYGSTLRQELETRIKAYFDTPDGAARLEKSMQEAADRMLSSKVLDEVLTQYVSREMGNLARNAVAKALVSEKKKSEKKAKAK